MLRRQAEAQTERLRAKTEALLKAKSRRVEEDKNKQAAIDEALAAIPPDLPGRSVEETIVSLGREVGRLRKVVNMIREFVSMALQDGAASKKIWSVVQKIASALGVRPPEQEKGPEPE